MLYVIEGHMRSAFVEENGGEGAVVNDLYQGDVMFFPQGLIHYQQNIGCEPATFLAALTNEDPGVVMITTRFFELPSEAIEVGRPRFQQSIKDICSRVATGNERWSMELKCLVYMKLALCISRQQQQLVFLFRNRWLDVCAGCSAGTWT